MFSTFRKLINFWGSANTSVPENPNATSTNAAPTESCGSSPAYCAAFNYAPPPPQYAKRLFRAPSPPIAPHSALSGFFFSRVEDTGTPYMRNIPQPQVPLFGTTAAIGACQSVSDHLAESEDIDMHDANFQSHSTPPATPPGGDHAQHSSNEASQHNGQGIGAEFGAVNESANAVPVTSVDRNDRPQLIPVRQQTREGTPTTPQPKKNWVDEIEIEEDTTKNNLPVGYLGTFRGSRHFIPKYPGMLSCSHNTKHLLLCGHWVSSSEPCGSNCRKQNHAEKPFNCPTCHDIVREVLSGSALSAVEAMRLRKLKDKGNSIVFVACCVEQVVRLVSQIKSGITEAVAGLLLPDYGRKCEQTENPDPEELETIERIVRDMQELFERKQRERFARENPLTTHEKRKSYEDAMNLSINAGNFANDGSAEQNEQPRDSSSTGEDKKQDVSSANNKRQKTKLKSHRESITPQNRGTKRSSPSFCSSDDDVSPFAFVPSSKPLSVSTRKVYTPLPPTFGQPSFLSPLASVVEATTRKHRNDEDVDDEGIAQVDGGFKRCRVEGWRASQEEVETKMPGFAGFTAAWDEGKDDS